MKKIMEKAIRFKLRTISGILVPAPVAMRENDIDFMLIGEDGNEYHLVGNRKTFQMWNLIDTKVQIKALVKKNQDHGYRVSTLTFRCVDDFVDTDILPINQLDDFDFDRNRFDYAI